MGSGNNPWFTDSLEQHRVQTSNGLVEFADVGDGIPILYFHGNDAGNDVAALVEKSLIVDGFRLVMPNRPGYYGTPIDSGLSFNDCADLAAELLDHLAIGKVIVIGTSGGGPAACRFAAQHSERCIALIMQCGLSHPFDAGRWMPQKAERMWLIFRYLWLFRPLLRLGHRMQTRKRSRGEFVSDCMSTQRFAELKDCADLKSLEPLLAAAMVRCAEQPAGIENDWANWAGKPWLTPGIIRCPTLILHDRDDVVVPFAHAEWTAHCIPAAEFVELHVGGHLIWVGRDADRMRRKRAEFIRQQWSCQAAT